MASVVESLDLPCDGSSADVTFENALFEDAPTPWNQTCEFIAGSEPHQLKCRGLLPVMATRSRLMRCMLMRSDVGVNVDWRVLSATPLDTEAKKQAFRFVWNMMHNVLSDNRKLYDLPALKRWQREQRSRVREENVSAELGLGLPPPVPWLVPDVWTSEFQKLLHILNYLDYFGFARIMSSTSTEDVREIWIADLLQVCPYRPGGPCHDPVIVDSIMRDLQHRPEFTYLKKLGCVHSLTQLCNWKGGCRELWSDTTVQDWKVRKGARLYWPARPFSIPVACKRYCATHERIYVCSTQGQATLHIRRKITEHDGSLAWLPQTYAFPSQQLAVCLFHDQGKVITLQVKKYMDDAIAANDVRNPELPVASHVFSDVFSRLLTRRGFTVRIDAADVI